MNKVIAAICVLISSVLAFALVMIMIAGITGHTVFSWGVSNLRFYSGGESSMVKEESVVLTDFENLTLYVPSNKVYVRSTNSDKLTVRQYGPSELSGDELFTMSKSGDTVSVSVRSRGFVISIFFWANEYIELEIPAGWLGNVNLETSSGGINIEDSFEWNALSLKCSSGGINLERQVKADAISIKVSSGGIKTEYLEANALSIESSSGGISLRDKIKAGELYLRCTSGGIKTELLDTETFNIESSSGGMKISELNGQGNIKCTSGGIKVDMLNPTGNVDIRCSSGGILVDVPKELAHFVSTRATSGGVVINER